MPRELTVRADDRDFRVRVRIDTPEEQRYFRHGGILQFRAARGARARLNRLKLTGARVDSEPMSRIRTLLLALLTAAGLLTAVPLGAQARGHTHWIVADGFYAGMDSNGDLAFFHVKHRRVYHLRFSLTLACHDSAGPDTSPNFSAGSAMPQGRLIPSNGILRLSWIEEDSARDGHIRAVISFRTHPYASFAVDSSGTIETCSGDSAVDVQRARATPPVPTRP